MKKQLKKLVVGTAAAITLAVPTATITAGTSNGQEAKASGFSFGNSSLTYNNGYYWDGDEWDNIYEDLYDDYYDWDDRWDYDWDDRWDYLDDMYDFDWYDDIYDWD